MSHGIGSAIKPDGYTIHMIGRYVRMGVTFGTVQRRLKRKPRPVSRIFPIGGLEDGSYAGVFERGRGAWNRIYVQGSRIAKNS
jgi:hypothetical protein